MTCSTTRKPVCSLALATDRGHDWHELDKRRHNRCSQWMRSRAAQFEFTARCWCIQNGPNAPNGFVCTGDTNRKVFSLRMRISQPHRQSSIFYQFTIAHVLKFTAKASRPVVLSYGAVLSFSTPAWSPRFSVPMFSRVPFDHQADQCTCSTSFLEIGCCIYICHAIYSHGPIYCHSPIHILSQFHIRHDF